MCGDGCSSPTTQAVGCGALVRVGWHRGLSFLPLGSGSQRSALCWFPSPLRVHTCSDLPFNPSPFLCLQRSTQDLPVLSVSLQLSPGRLWCHLSATLMPFILLAQ